jgi:hypothetical protein
MFSTTIAMMGEQLRQAYKVPNVTSMFILRVITTITQLTTSKYSPYQLFLCSY